MSVNWSWVRFQLWSAVRADDPKHLKRVIAQTIHRMGGNAPVHAVLAALQTQMWRENNALDRTGRPRGGILVVAATNGALNCVRQLMHLPQPAGEYQNALERAGADALPILREIRRTNWREASVPESPGLRA
jgi:hypothetical protein